jgi:hypothetical protein
MPVRWQGHGDTHRPTGHTPGHGCLQLPEPAGQRRGLPAAEPVRRPPPAHTHGPAAAVLRQRLPLHGMLLPRAGLEAGRHAGSARGLALALIHPDRRRGGQRVAVGANRHEGVGRRRDSCEMLFQGLHICQAQHVQRGTAVPPAADGLALTLICPNRGRRHGPVPAQE